MQCKRIVELIKGVGRFKVGGLFSLIDQNGNIVMDEDLKGCYFFVSVGVFF